MLFGAPFLASRETVVGDMVRLSGIRPGERAADLGSGDGRVLIAFARAGALAFGYELNPLLVWHARRAVQAAGFSNQAPIHWRNFWNVDPAAFDVVAVFGVQRIMEKLEKKLQRELKSGARVVSNYFTFPTWPCAKSVGDAYLYVVPDTSVNAFSK